MVILITIGIVLLYLLIICLFAGDISNLSPIAQAVTIFAMSAIYIFGVVVFFILKYPMVFI